MKVVRMIGIDRDVHNLLDNMLWDYLLEFMNIPLMLEPEPVDRDVEIALSTNQLRQNAFREPPIMPERNSPITQAPKNVRLRVRPNGAHSFPDARISK
ncbi:UNVERIFIED_CONTAM: hypothetical protein Sradi_0692200 [Sesamum radiatum]|uniref:Uncharacterized protein n=1 Tax=Sesamum radiatum TaxID=300843 RepID=A0AAW2VME8_SESRA